MLAANRGGDPNITLKVYAHLFNREQRDDAVWRALSATAEGQQPNW